MTETTNVTGEVDFYNSTGMYGFIQVDTEDENVFFHIDDIDCTEEELEDCEGKQVTINYKQSETRTGTELRATKVEF